MKRVAKRRCARGNRVDSLPVNLRISLVVALPWLRSSSALYGESLSQLVDLHPEMGRSPRDFVRQ